MNVFEKLALTKIKAGGWEVNPSDMRSGQISWRLDRGGIRFIVRFTEMNQLSVETPCPANSKLGISWDADKDGHMFWARMMSWDDAKKFLKI